LKEDKLIQLYTTPDNYIKYINSKIH